MMFKTRSANGLLLYAGWYPEQRVNRDYLQLEIKNRKVVLTANLGSGRFVYLR